MSDSTICHWASQSHSGSRKPQNDDCLVSFASGIQGATILPPSGSHSLAQNDLIFAISDGMGGGNAGDLASSLLLSKMSEMIPEVFKIAASGFFPDCLEHLSDTIRFVHQHINDSASCDQTRGMAATLALAWFTPENLYIANAGDSRIYLSRNGSLTQLSRDHTTAWNQWKRGEISEIQYRTHPRRAALYEVIGGNHQLVNPYLAAIPYLPGDRFLICSDGLIDGLWERHISNALALDESPETIVNQLSKRAINNSGVDDTSLTVIHLS